MSSNFVRCATRAQALEVIDACLLEGFKAVASENLNGPGWVVEYWQPKHNGHVIAFRKATLKNSLGKAKQALAVMHQVAS